MNAIDEAEELIRRVDNNIITHETAFICNIKELLIRLETAEKVIDSAKDESESHGLHKMYSLRESIEKLDEDIKEYEELK